MNGIPLDNTHRQVASRNAANEILDKARDAVITRISEVCPLASKEISSLVRQHIEIFGLQRSLETMSADQIAAVVVEWEESVSYPGR